MMASDEYMRGWNACMLGDAYEQGEEFQRGWADAQVSPEYILYEDRRNEQQYYDTPGSHSEIRSTG